MKPPPDTLIDALATETEVAERRLHIQHLAGRPLYFFGAGFYARELKDFLEAYGVCPTACFVDRPYAHQTSIDGIDVRSTEELYLLEPPFTLAVAHCHGLDETIDTLQRQYKIAVEHIIVIDCRFYKRFAQFEDYIKHIALKDFEQVYQWLEDDLSKHTLIEYLNAKILHDSSALRLLKTNRQYFPDDLREFTPRLSDRYIDAGAFTGDTLAELLDLISGQHIDKYVAFEPDPANAQSLKNMVACRHLDFVDIHPTGVWSSAAELRFSSCDDSRSGLSDAGDIKIKVESIDDLDIIATCIKMDIEGAELEALRGARQTITVHKPRLTLAVYHKPEDLREITFLIKQYCPKYKFHLRIHSSFSEELVLYAIAE